MSEKFPELDAVIELEMAIADFEQRLELLQFIADSLRVKNPVDQDDNGILTSNYKHAKSLEKAIRELGIIAERIIWLNTEAVNQVNKSKYSTPIIVDNLD